MYLKKINEWIICFLYLKNPQKQQPNKHSSGIIHESVIILIVFILFFFHRFWETPSTVENETHMAQMSQQEMGGIPKMLPG